MRDEELTTISSREVGARMRRARLDCGLSLAELGEKVGVAADQIGAWENGQGVAPFDTIRAIAAALGTTSDTFVS